MDPETTTMNERLGFGHALIFAFAITLSFCAFLAICTGIGFLGAWLIVTGYEAFVGALSGLGVML